MRTRSPQSVTAPRRRFGHDVAWVLGSLIIAGLGGVAANTIIARLAGPAALGVFNQAFAIYIILTQVAVGSLQFSVLHRVSQKPDDPAHAAHAATSALVLVGFLSAAMCAIAWLARGWVGRILASDDLPAAIGYLLPGLFVYALNKVLLYVLNGVRHMRAYAVFQSLRFVLLLGAICVLAVMGRPAAELTLSLTIAEIVLFIGLAAYIRLRLFSFQLGPSWRADCRSHMRYGIRGFLSGVLHEVNTRVDILLLGYFLHDTAIVGIYSFAAILAEGFAQIPLAVRTNVDPIIGRHISEQQAAQIEDLARRLRTRFFPLMLALGAASVALYPVLLRMLRMQTEFGASWAIFAILAAGICLNARFRPFLGILLQSGRPGAHTLLVGVVVLSNALLNVALIPVFGAVGSAIATATAFLIEAGLIAGLGRKLVGVRL